MTPMSFLCNIPSRLMFGLLVIGTGSDSVNRILDPQEGFDHNTSETIDTSIQPNKDSHTSAPLAVDSSPSICSLDYAPNASHLVGNHVEEIGVDLRNLEADCELFDLFQRADDTKVECHPSFSRHSPSNFQSVILDDENSTAVCQRTFPVAFDHSNTGLTVPSGYGATDLDTEIVSSPTEIPHFSDNTDPITTAKPYNNSIPPTAVTTDSVVWLAKRVGPLLSARYLVPHLLATLVVSYAGEHLVMTATLSAQSSSVSGTRTLPMPLQVTNRPLAGDETAAGSLRCLEHLVHMYGVAFVLHIFIPYVQRTISTVITTVGLPASEAAEIDRMSATTSCLNISQSGWNVRTLGKLVAALTLLHQFVAYIPDSTLSDYLRDSILQDILHESIRIAGRLDCPSPCGSNGRLAILCRIIDCIYVIGLRIGFEMTRTHMTSLFQAFFALFDRVAALSEQEKTGKDTPASNLNHLESHSVVMPDNSDAQDQTEFSSDDPLLKCNPDVLVELFETFTNDLARVAYIPFCRLAGGAFIDTCIYNSGWIQELVGSQPVQRQDSSSKSIVATFTSSPHTAASPMQQTGYPIQEMALLAGCSVFHDDVFHLRGAWPDFFQQEVDSNCATRNRLIHYRAGRLASFLGHNSRINSIELVDAENCFVTASHDRTVQLWSLSDSYNTGHSALSLPTPTNPIPVSPLPSGITSASSAIGLQGKLGHAGSGRNTPIEPINPAGPCVTARLVYRGHKRPVFSAFYLETYRLVASCDGHLVLWDPWTGQKVRGVCGSHSSHLTALSRCYRPHNALFCADVNANIRLVDPRMQYSQVANPLKFPSGSTLASLLKSGSRSTSPKVKMYQNSLPADSVTRRLALLASITQSPKNFLPNQTGSNFQTISNSGTLTRLVVCDGTHTLLCGFTSGFLTAIDLRQLQVIHAWQAHTDAIIQLGCTSTDWFVSAGDRSLAFWCLNSELNLECFRSSDHLLRGSAYKTDESGRMADAGFTGSGGMSSISHFSSYNNDLIVCGPASTLTGTTSVTNVSGLFSGPSDGSSHNPVSATSGADLLGVYRLNAQGNINYQALGRIPSNHLRGRVTTFNTLSLSGLFLVGSQTGAVSLLY